MKPVTNNDDYPGTIPLAKSAPELQLVAVKEATGASVTVFAGKVTGVIGQLGDSDIIRIVAPAAGFLGVKLVRSSDSKLNPFLVVYATDATTGKPKFVRRMTIPVVDGIPMSRFPYWPTKRCTFKRPVPWEPLAPSLCKHRFELTTLATSPPLGPTYG